MMIQKSYNGEAFPIHFLNPIGFFISARNGRLCQKKRPIGCLIRESHNRPFKLSRRKNESLSTSQSIN